MKAYVTKYALTEGIQELEGELTKCGKYFYNHGHAGARYGEARFFHNKSHWTTDKAEAVKRAEAMRTKKISSLKKQIAKLEKISFS